MTFKKVFTSHWTFYIICLKLINLIKREMFQGHLLRPLFTDKNMKVMFVPTFDNDFIPNILYKLSFFHNNPSISFIKIRQTCEFSSLFTIGSVYMNRLFIHKKIKAEHWMWTCLFPVLYDTTRKWGGYVAIRHTYVMLCHCGID